MLAALIAVVELSIKGPLIRCQAISHHMPRLLVSDFLGLLESLSCILDFSALGHYANKVESGSLIHDIPKPSPFSPDLDLHLIRMPYIA